MHYTHAFYIHWIHCIQPSTSNSPPVIRSREARTSQAPFASAPDSDYSARVVQRAHAHVASERVAVFRPRLGCEDLCCEDLYPVDRSDRLYYPD